MRTGLAIVLTAVVTAAAVKVTDLRASDVEITVRKINLEGPDGTLQGIIEATNEGAAIVFCDDVGPSCTVMNRFGFFVADSFTDLPVAELAYSAKPLRIYRVNGKVKFAR